MNKIRKGDEVIVIAGKDKGARGAVNAVTSSGKVLVEGANIAKKHQKPNPNAAVAGGIVNKEMPLAISNVAIFNSQEQRADRVGFKFLDDGRKIRVFKSTGEAIDV